MSWNYRIIKNLNSNGDFEYGIYEVYYDEKGKVIGNSENSVTPVCLSAEDLKYEIKSRMMNAFEKEILSYDEK